MGHPTRITRRRRRIRTGAHGRGADLGLDDIRNATKKPKDEVNAKAKWVGIVVDPNTGEPIKQSSGFYLSPTTMMQYTGYPKEDPRRYVDASTIPYMAFNKRLLGKAFIRTCCGRRSSGWPMEDAMAGYRPGDASQLYHSLELALKKHVDAESDAEFTRTVKGPSRLTRGHIGGRDMPLRLDPNNPSHRPLVRKWLRIRDDQVLQLASGPIAKGGLPPLVSQGESTMHCWAAALESLLAVAKKMVVKKDALVARFGEKDRNGGLDLGSDEKIKTTFGAIAREYDLAFRVLPGRDMTHLYLAEKLRDTQYLLIMYLMGGGIAHTIVAYGLRIDSGTASHPDASTVILMMDPTIHDGHGIVPLTRVAASPRVLIAHSR